MHAERQLHGNLRRLIGQSNGDGYFNFDADGVRDRNFVGDLDSDGVGNPDRVGDGHANSFGNRRDLNRDLYRDGDYHYRDRDLDRNAIRNADDDTYSDRDGDPAMRSEFSVLDHYSRRHSRLW